MKRALDIGLSAIGLLVAAPLLVVAAFGVWLDLGRPILFRQWRPGRQGIPFELIKFRTMRTEEPQHPATSDAERLTRFGRLLRSTSLDELPELLNVLRGDMSLVGPRPLLMEYLPLYSAEQARRHDVRPGLTGWAQIHGRNQMSWSRRLELDAWYVDHQSLMLDLKILARTVGMVLRRRGISSAGEATMPKFRGNGAA
jgi:lipopolysaccharide/colanic/teichoic acid biosynthesis glycosyltransferase